MTDDTTATRVIKHTAEPMTQPWPEEIFVQGGGSGLVLSNDGEHYRTAFVEAFPVEPPTFIRGEGATIAEAEASAWRQYSALVDCPTHPEHGPFEARGYTNGSGFCVNCGRWLSKVLPVTDVPADGSTPRPPGVLAGFFEQLLALAREADEADEDATIEQPENPAQVVDRPPQREEE